MALHLHTLGTWHLADAAGERRLEPGKPLALLTYLALTPRHRAGREHLIDLLWSESEPTRARQALRQTVWNLRQVIGADALSSDGDELCLTGAIGSDCHVFLRHVERGEIEQAVAAYGGPFLPDFAAPGGAAFEQWADVERNRLHAAYVRVLEALVRRELSAGRVRDADALARRLRDTDPERESAWRLLLEVLLSAGDRSGAALAADALEVRLRADGRDPEQATRTLIARTRSEDGTPSPDLGPLHPDLVGREQEFAALLSAWRAARKKPGRHVHITSPAGLGKTRLLRDLAVRLSAVGGRVCAVRANAGERNVPWGLAADLASALAALAGAAAVSPGSAAALVALDPALSARYPAARASTSAADDAARERGRALAELVSAVADEQPLALLVDDVHWADAQSAQALAALVNRLAEVPALVVTAARPAGAVPPAGVDTVTIRLASLTPGQVLELLGSLGAWHDGPWPRELADALARTSGGSPLLVLETMQLALEHGDLAVAARRWHADDLPALVRGLGAESALRRRLDRLAPDEREVMTLLAVAGAPVADEILADAAARPLADAARTLGTLELRGFARRVTAGWEPAHDLLTEELLAGLAVDAKGAAHAALGRALAGAARGDLAAFVPAARHLVLGGAEPALDALFREWVAASFRRGERRGRDELAVALLAEHANAERVARLVRGLPWRYRARYLTTPALVTLLLLAIGLWVADRVQAARSRFVQFAIEPLGTESIAPGRLRFRPVPTVEVRGSDGSVDEAWSDTVHAELAPDSRFEIVSGAATVARRGRAAFDELVLRLRDPVPAGAGPTRLRVSARGIDAVALVELPAPGNTGLRFVGANVNGAAAWTDGATGVPVVRVSSGDSILGHVALRYTTYTRDEETVVLGYTPTWGDPATAYRFVQRLAGPAVDAPVAFPFALVAPRRPGSYFIVIAFGLETDAAYLFSGTNWVVGRPIWGDGNDIAAWPVDSLLRAARTGQVGHTKTYLVRDSAGRRLDHGQETLAVTALQIVVAPSP